MSGVWDAAGPEPRAADRLRARLSARGGEPCAFRSVPEPVLIGRPARGRHLLDGHLRFAGHLVEIPAGVPPWGFDLPDAVMAELHRFAWLDDLAALGGRTAWGTARSWTLAWTRRFGRGTGAGWTAARTGRRLMAWIDHAAIVEAGPEAKGFDADFRRSLGAQGRFLARRWRAAPPGPARVEALTGLLRAGLALSGMGLPVDAAADALAVEGDAALLADGAVPSRNAERLAELHARLAWAARALEAADRTVPDRLAAALGRAAPVLRSLRHADGALVRMHGAGGGVEGRLDAALSRGGASRVERMAMGFARLSEGRVTVIADAGRPPEGHAGRGAHASTLAIEVTAGREPLVVSCGSGAPFGPDWRRVGRATASHSVLGLEGISSSRLEEPVERGGEVVELLGHGPREVARAIGTRRGAGAEDPGALVLDLSHDGWRESHGLIYRRQIALSRDGREVTGEEVLAAETDRDVRLLALAADHAGEEGIGFAVRFHLHPDAEVSADAGGVGATVALPSGALWMLRHDGVGRLSVEPSVYFDPSRLHPLAAQQIVLSGRVEEAATHLRWSLARADRVAGTRDLE